MPHNERNLDGPSTMPSDEDGWWEIERAKFIDARVERLVGPTARIADIGCGRASLLREMASGGRDVVRVDSHVWDEWEGRPGVFVCAAADALPFGDGVFDLVGSFDVLEHLRDDDVALNEQSRVCRSGGNVVAAVPADPRLWSAHDLAVGHVRRYTTEVLSTLGDRAGLAVGATSHFFSYLWLPAWLSRRSTVRTSEPALAKGRLSVVVDSVMAVFGRLERAWLRRTTIPFGTSIWTEWKR